jgi:hypothetical protein
MSATPLSVAWCGMVELDMLNLLDQRRDGEAQGTKRCPAGLGPYTCLAVVLRR